MTQSLLDSLIGTNPLTFVNDDDQYEYFKDLAPISVMVNQSCLVAKDPLSMEQVSEDYTYLALLEEDVKSGKIVRPSALKITALCDNLSTVESMLKAFADTKSTFTVTSKQIISDFMAIISIEATQDAEHISATRLVIDMEQTKPFSSQVGVFDPNNPADESSYGIRIATPPSVLDNAISAVDNLSSSAEALYNKVSNYVTGLL